MEAGELVRREVVIRHPRSALKYLRLGPAFRVRTGTTKRNPSAEATSPPPHAWAKATVDWVSTRQALARVRSQRGYSFAGPN